MSHSRRTFLRTGLASSLSFALSPALMRLHAAEATKAASTKGAKACILVFLEGGPSHIDLFDPKPGQKTGGTFKAIDTKLPGVQFSEHLPKLAEMADKLAVIRSLTSKEGDHDRAVALLHTGYAPTEAVAHPALGAMVAHASAAQELNAPAYVAIGETVGAGFLGPEFSPHIIEDINNPASSIALPEGVTEERLERRVKALDKFNQEFAQRADKARVEDFRRLTRQANRLRKSPALQPWDPATEKPELLEAYGASVADGGFARSCLTARRMIQHGAKFVELRLGGWDTHSDNFNQVQTLSQQLDPGLATLITDLATHGLLESTLVVCVGEFGRTPQINGDNGRDHWSDAFGAVLAGGGIKTGQVHGSTDAEGAQVKDNPLSIPDLCATLLTALGIDSQKQYRTPDGRPIKPTNNGQPVASLLS